MGLSTWTNSVSHGSTPTTQSNASLTYNVSYSGYGQLPCSIFFESSSLKLQWGYSAVNDNTVVWGAGDVNGTYYPAASSLSADRTVLGRGRVSWDYSFGGCSGTANGATLYKRTKAMVATAQTPGSASVTATTATIDCDYTPNVNESSCSAQLKYKKTADSTWTSAGSPKTTGGYSQINESEAITGLDGETQYQVKLVITRGTQNDTSLTSAIASFTTLADTPEVTTDAATGVTSDTASLNATVDHNTKDGDLSWRYDTSDPGTADDTSGTEVAYAGNPITEDGSGAYGISSLTHETKYYFWAIYEPDVGDKTYGAILDFTTETDPSVEAKESEMLPVFQYDRKWGIATTVFFTLPSPAGTSSDRLYDGAAVWAAGECKVTGVVYDDDSTPTVTAEANTDSEPAREAATNLYRLDLAAGEMEHDELYITIVDDTPAHRDITLFVRTHQMLSTIDVDASSKATNTTAVTYTGNGTGAGMDCTGGATGKDLDANINNHVLDAGTLQSYDSSTTVTLAATAPGVADGLNGAVILFNGGTGADQARTIIDDDGSQQVTLNKALTSALDGTTTYIIIPGDDVWAISPVTELAAIPTKASTTMQLLQGIFQRFFYQREQTATVQTLRKEDDSTSLGTATVSDNGTTQTSGRVT